MKHTVSYNNSTITFTTQKPSGVDYQWYFYPYENEYRSVKVRNKICAEKKFFFKN
ncbi:MAG: hypothetical protein FWH18_06340 [Marinilabiliaceae bacterium]|nr:hypothetical protein [Marinilabiliaceae bacterium]